MAKDKITGHAPVNGLSLYYEIHGNGSVPLVLIHGGGSTIDSTFGTLLPLFARNQKVIALEQQAHGRTSDRNAPVSFEQDADDVAALLNFLKVKKANILGFSNGGTTTLQIAIRHPDLINKIIPVSCNYQREGMIKGLLENMPNATLPEMPKPLQDAFLAVTPSAELLQNMFEKDKARMIHFSDIPEEKLKAIHFPALIILGDQDVVTIEHALKMSRLLPHSRLAVLPGNHGSFIGEACTPKKPSQLPELLVAMVNEFLEETN